MSYITSKQLKTLPPATDRNAIKQLLGKGGSKTIDFFPVSFSDNNIDNHYCIVIHGNFIEGTPGCVIVENPKCPIYVKCEEGDFEPIKRLLASTDKRLYYTKEFVAKKPFVGFYPDPISMVALNFNNTYQRNIAINLLETRGYEVFDNDKSSLYKLVWARHNLNSCNWLTLTNFSSVTTPLYSNVTTLPNYSNKRNTAITLEVDIANISNTPDKLDLYHTGRGQRKVAWDIETATEGNFSAKITYDRFGIEQVKTLAMAFQWINGDKIIDIVLTTKKSAPSKDFWIIECRNEKDLIFTFFKVIHYYEPNIFLDFNGYKFDWPMVLFRMRYYGLENQVNDLMRHGDIRISLGFGTFGFDEKIKIKVPNNPDWLGHCYHFINGVAVDLLPLLKKEFEYQAGDKANLRSLNDFLIDNDLEQKSDMPYEVMARIFKTGTEEEMLKVLKYNLRDCNALHDLDNKRFMAKAVNEVANITFTTFHVGIFNANGLKIVNAVRNEAYKDNKLLTKKDNRHETSGAFGGLVLDRDVGLHAYNIFDMDEYSPMLQEELKSRDWSFRNASIKQNKQYIADIPSPKCRRNLKVWRKRFPAVYTTTPWVADRPCVSWDYASLYPSVERQNNMSPDTSLTQEELDYWLGQMTLVTCDKNIGVEGKDGQVTYQEVPRFTEDDFEKHTFAGKTKWLYKHRGDVNKMGVIVRLLDRLFKHRLSIKEQVKAPGTTSFLKSLLTTREKGVKLILNTTYGLYGEKNNAYFRDEFLFQGTCNFARQYLLYCKLWLEHYGCLIRYGDTDSNYFCPPEYIYAEIDLAYSRREISLFDYNRLMVELSIEWSTANILIFNGILAEENPFLSVTYEECIYRLLMIKAKHYIGLICVKGFVDLSQITDRAKFNKAILQRGVVTRKKDRSKFVKECFMDLVVQMQDINLKCSLAELCANQISSLLNNKYEREIFRQFASFRKDNKGNVKLNTFVLRMYDLYDREIEDLEKFQYYIVIRPDNDFTIDGKRITKVGDKMWLCDKADEEGLQLDMKYYAESYIKVAAGLLTYKLSNAQAQSFLKEAIPKGMKRIVETNDQKAIFKKYADMRLDFVSVYSNLRLIKSHQFLHNILDACCDYVTSKIFIGEVKLELLGEGFRITENGYQCKIKFFTYKKGFISDMQQNIEEIKEESGPYRLKEALKEARDVYKKDFNRALSKLNSLSEECHEIITSYQKYLEYNVLTERRVYYSGKNSLTSTSSTSDISNTSKDLSKIKPKKNPIKEEHCNKMNKLKKIISNVKSDLYYNILFYIAQEF